MVADLFKDAVFSSINYTYQKSKFTECRISLSRLFLRKLKPANSILLNSLFWQVRFMLIITAAPNRLPRKKWLGRVDISA